jgi:fermentation-respiration switch protein FrsA (DUF1100 family)
MLGIGKLLRGIIWAVVFLVGAGITVVLYFFLFQSRYIYFPEPDILAEPSSIGLPFENITLETADGLKLSGWFIPGREDSGVVLFCHGNAGNISHRLASIQIFHRLGLNVFIFAYRGYGLSKGKITEPGIYRDAEAAWHYLVEERKFASGRIIIFGRSLGGAVASRLARQTKPGALILESSFTSLAAMARSVYPYLPTKLILRPKFNTAENLDRISCPILIIHSRQDEIIPFSHGVNLFALAREPKEFLEISGGHNECFITSGEGYTAGLKKFLSTYAGVEP